MNLILINNLYIINYMSDIWVTIKTHGNYFIVIVLLLVENYLIDRTLWRK
jgi:intracellular septation protein A